MVFRRSSPNSPSGSQFHVLSVLDVQLETLISSFIKFKSFLIYMLHTVIKAVTAAGIAYITTSASAMVPETLMAR